MSFNCEHKLYFEEITRSGFRNFRCKKCMRQFLVDTYIPMIVCVLDSSNRVVVDYTPGFFTRNEEWV